MNLPQQPCLLTSRVIHARRVNASLSAGLADPAWDDFLRGVAVGQFQQSSLWSQSKRSEGWQCLRVIMELEEAIVGGFQVLWKTTRLGRVGYISKGPALAPGLAELETFALDLLIELARSGRLAVIVAQPPDHCPSMVDAMQSRGFAANRITKVIDATLWADLSGPPGEWEANLRGGRRTEIRKGLRSGTTIYEGGEADIPLFFELMKSSCDRQGVRPTPPTLEAVSQLALAFRKEGESRLAFAVCQGEAVAAVLDLRFGNRFTTWKKGWNGRHGKQHPNAILTHDSMRKAHQLGCACFDFAGVERPFAEALLAQQPLSEAQQNHYDFYKLGFGAQPRLLPPAMIYCRNPLLRFVYRHIAARPWLAARLKRLARKL